MKISEQQIFKLINIAHLAVSLSNDKHNQKSISDFLGEISSQQSTELKEIKE